MKRAPYTAAATTAALLLLPLLSTAFAADAKPHLDTGDTAWMLMSAALVFLMTPGLAFFFGGLTRALGRAIEAHGGQVFVNAPVQDILVKNGRAQGVRLENGEVYTARAVVSGTHVLTTAQALPAEYVPRAAREVRVGNGFGMILRLALSEKVRYRHHHEPESRVGLGLLIKSERQLMKGYGEYLAGEPTTDPPLIAMSFSAVDDSLAPPDGEVLWLWAQYYPYELASGTWDSTHPASRQAEARENILNAFEHYAPGTRENIVGELVQTPLWLERNLNLHRGNVMHLEMTFDQMFALRPWAGASHYRWPGVGWAAWSTRCAPTGPCSVTSVSSDR